MLKSAFALGLVAAALTFVPAQAAESMCNEAGMMKMQSGVEKMTDASKKEMAMKEMAMAKDGMAKKDDKECMMHMDKIKGMM